METWGRQREVGETISGLCGRRKGKRDGASDEREGKHDLLRERGQHRSLGRSSTEGVSHEAARRALEICLSQA